MATINSLIPEEPTPSETSYKEEKGQRKEEREEEGKKTKNDELYHIQYKYM